MISIIITSYKEPKTIGRAITAIIEQKIPAYELLIVAPDEETLDEARKYAKKYRQIKVIKDAGEGKPAALNLAFKKALGEIIIMTDGDVFVSKNSISKLIPPFLNPRVGAVSGRPVSLNPKSDMMGFWGHLLADVADKRRKTAVQIKKRFFCSGYLYAIRAGIINELPKNLLVEDGYISHLVWKKGYTIAYAPEAEVFVKYPQNIKDWIKQKVRSAGGYLQLKDTLGVEIRSFKKESAGIFDVLAYPKNIKEFFWLSNLLFVRLYLWFLILFKFKIKKEKSFKKIWQRVESTK